MSALKYWIWLAAKKGIGIIRFRELLDNFGSPEDVFLALERDYLDIRGISRAEIKELTDKDLTGANMVLSSCSQIGCRVITLNDSEYPERLKNIYDPPPLLYINGTLPIIDDEPVVGIVGTRKCTPYGLNVARNTAYNLSQNGVIVATGLAQGIDTAAAEGALKGGSKVIGVIGSGLDVIFPYENKKLFSDVSYNGAVISEYPPGTPGLKSNFPARNRIISGLSLGVAVIEAPKRSGALITAARALEQGRDVFALPGNVDASVNEGSNALLREGATPFSSADDIIGEYAALYPHKLMQKKSIDNTSKVDYIDLGNLLSNLDGDEKAVMESINSNSVPIDEIIVTTGFPASKILSVLTLLEINGYIGRTDSGTWKILTHAERTV